MLTNDSMLRLVSGYAYHEAARLTTEELRAIWQQHRAEILRHYIARNPGRRPWAFWAFDVSERRRCVAGVDPLIDPERIAHVAKYEAEHPGYADRANALSFGVLHCRCGPDLKWRDEDYPQYESQAEFLGRHNLLTADERRALNGRDLADCPDDDTAYEQRRAAHVAGIIA